MLRLLGLAVLLFASMAQAEPGGQIVDLDLSPPVDLVLTPPADLVFKTTDFGFTVIDLAGRTQDLQVKETATEIRIELAADVLFDFDKSTIRPQAAAALHTVAEIINDKGKGRSVRIDGHTDAKGSDAYNQALSERRAASVRQWLIAKEGLGKIKMSPQGFGAKRPVAPNAKPDGSDDPEGRQKNRRVEIVLAK